MPDFLDEKVREIRDRVEELKPLVDEYHRLRAAIDALDATTPRSGATKASAPTHSGATKASVPTRRRERTSLASSRRRPRAGAPSHADRLAELVRDQPGVTIAQAGRAMDVLPNGLYQVVAKLSQMGLVRKDGTGLFPSGGQGAAEGNAEDRAAHEPMSVGVDADPPAQTDSTGDQAPAKPAGRRRRARAKTRTAEETGIDAQGDDAAGAETSG